MSSTNTSLTTTKSLEEAVAVTQETVAAFSRAYARIAEGFVGAWVAQLDLATSLMTARAQEWERVRHASQPQQVLAAELRAMRTQMDVAIRGARRIADEFRVCSFDAAAIVAERLAQNQATGDAGAPDAERRMGPRPVPLLTGQSPGGRSTPEPAVQNA